MVAVGALIELVLWAFIMLLVARIVVEWVQMLARGWEPRGVVLVICEGIYTATDPPVKAFRRVVPPLRLGAVALDVSIILLFVAVWVLRYANDQLLLSA